MMLQRQYLMQWWLSMSSGDKGCRCLWYGKVNYITSIKRLEHLNKKCGYGMTMVFHSFRKGIASQLENSGVPENITARLLGHEFYTMSYGVCPSSNDLEQAA